MVKVVALVRRLPSQPREEFLRHWVVEHPDYVRALPGLRRYVQSPAVERSSTTWAFDGMAELYFDSVKDVAVAFDSGAADRLREHELAFVGELVWFLADETEVGLRPDDPSDTAS